MPRTNNSKYAIYCDDASTVNEGASSFTGNSPDDKYDCSAE